MARLFNSFPRRTLPAGIALAAASGLACRSMAQPAVTFVSIGTSGVAYPTSNDPPQVFGRQTDGAGSLSDSATGLRTFDPMGSAYASASVNAGSSASWLASIAFAADDTAQIAPWSGQCLSVSGAYSDATCRLVLHNRCVLTTSLSTTFRLPDFVPGDSGAQPGYVEIVPEGNDGGSFVNATPGYTFSNGSLGASYSCFCNSVQGSVTFSAFAWPGAYDATAGAGVSFTAGECHQGMATPEGDASAHTTATLAFEQCLRITTEPQSALVAPSNSATLHAEAAGPVAAGDIVYKWYWNWPCQTGTTWYPVLPINCVAAQSMTQCASSSISITHGHINGLCGDDGVLLFCASGGDTGTLLVSNLVTSGINFQCTIHNDCDAQPTGTAAVTICAADFDNSGALAVADIFAFLNAWFAGNPSTDFDGLNGLQVADIFAFLNAWFAGC